jgi:hypothetical protein
MSKSEFPFLLTDRLYKPYRFICGFLSSFFKKIIFSKDVFHTKYLSAIAKVKCEKCTFLLSDCISFPWALNGGQGLSSLQLTETTLKT